MGLVAGVIAPGKRVEPTAPYLQLERELPSAPALGALEDHVLEHVGDAQLGGLLVGAGRADIDADRG